MGGFLGADLTAGGVTLDPCLPREWGGAALHLEGPNGRLEVTIEDPDNCGHGIARITVDGKVRKGRSVRFPGAGKRRQVVIRLGTQNT